MQHTHTIFRLMGVFSSSLSTKIKDKWQCNKPHSLPFCFSQSNLLSCNDHMKLKKSGVPRWLDLQTSTVQISHTAAWWEEVKARVGCPAPEMEREATAPGCYDRHTGASDLLFWNWETREGVIDVAWEGGPKCRPIPGLAAVRKTHSSLLPAGDFTVL